MSDDKTTEAGPAEEWKQLLVETFRDLQKREWERARAFVKEREPGLAEADLADLSRRLVEAAVAAETKPAPGDFVIVDGRPQEIIARRVLAAATPVFTPVEILTKQHEEREAQTLAACWPDVFAAWRASRRSLARLPTNLVTGAGAIAPLFGRALPPGTKVTPKRDGGGRLRNVVITRRTAQLDLLVPSRARIESPTDGQVLDTLARVLANREWRLFVAALVAAHEDHEAGNVPQPGGFLYTPGRFGGLLGLRDRDSTKKLDESLEALMGVSVTATVKRGGKDFRLTVESLVVDGRATLEPGAQKRGTGRPKARLYRIQDNILELLENGGSWFPVSREMLRTPEGVDPRRWDDGFKLETVMAAFARQEPGKARRPDDLPWKRKAATLLEAAGVSWEGARPSAKIERLRSLLELVNTTGRVVAEYDEATQTVRYDMPRFRSELRGLRPQNHRPTVHGRHP